MHREPGGNMEKGAVPLTGAIAWVKSYITLHAGMLRVLDQLTDYKNNKHNKLYTYIHSCSTGVLLHLGPFFWYQ